MSKTISKAKKCLLECIRSVGKNAWRFSVTPEKDFSRNRKLPFETMIKTLLCMEGGSLANELMKRFRCNPDAASTSAFVQRRSKILPEAFETIFSLFAEKADTVRLYKGYRLFAIDGSDIQIPTNPQDKDSYFPGSNGQKSFNLVHLNAMYDLPQRVYVDAIVQKRHCYDECRSLTAMVDRCSVKQPAIVIADRGYESYNVLAHIQEKGWYFLIRVKDAGRAGGFTKGLDSPSDSFTPDELKKLYAMRWGIETSFRALKYTIGLLHFHAKKTEHILQEIFARLIMYNFSELVTSHVINQKNNRKYAYRANFSVAVHICRQFFLGNVSPPNVETLIRRHVSPIQPGRSNPRISSPQNVASFTYLVLFDPRYFTSFPVGGYSPENFCEFSHEAPRPLPSVRDTGISSPLPGNTENAF